MAYDKKDLFEEGIVRTAYIAKALSHPARLVILKFLAEQSGCICGDIVEELPLSQATVSQHLKALKDTGLIIGEIDGPRICYSLDMNACRRAFEMLNKLFRETKCC